MTKVAFTAGRINSFNCPTDKHQAFLWDSKAPGLGLRVTPVGAKSFIFQGKLNKQTIRITLGDPRSWSIEQAQNEARRLQTLLDQDIDPRQQKVEQRTKAEAERLITKSKATLVSVAWQDYLNHHQSRWSDRHLKDHINLSQTGGQPKKRSKQLTTPGVLALLLSMRLSDITSPILVNWLKLETKNRPNNTRQAFEMFRAFWRWCATQPQYKNAIDVSAVEDRELRAHVPIRKSKKFDVLERSQLKPWFSAVRTLNPVMSAYLQTLILTGARREEMAALRWQDVDFQWNTLWVKDKVAEEGRKIPLTPYVAQLLHQLPRRNEWVFSSPTAADGKIAEPRIPHKRALSLAGLNHVTIHGLRRTFASLAEWVEMPRGIVAQIMGHAPNATAEKHYINRPIDLLATWHTKYEAWILEEAGVSFNPGQKMERLRAIK